ncbi:MAG: hypothetical protein ACFE9R_15885 [Candidatus Hermodarchaeota archaeon]
MALSGIEILNGSLSLIFVIITIFIAVLFLVKYLQYKSKLILLFGIILLLLISSWYASSSSFVIALFNGAGYMTSPQIYFIIGFIPLPIVAFIWSIAFTDLVYQTKKKIFRMIFGIVGIIMELIFFILLFIDPKLIGEVISPIDADYNLFITIYQFFLVLYMLITGILFGKESLKVDDAEIRLKGTLLIFAFISFVLGAILEILSGLSIVILIIARLILISSSFEFYGGFLLPEWIKKLFLRKI